MIGSISFRSLTSMVILALAAPVGLAQSYNPMAPGSTTNSAQQDDARPPPNPDLGNLPDAEGAEETYYQCSACHSTAIILQQKLSDARWDYLWDWMIEDQGMFDPEDDTKEIVLSYLKQYFSSEER